MFYQQLAQAICAATDASPAVSASEIYFLDGLAPQQCADLFLEKGQHCDAVALVSVDHPTINQAIDQLAVLGVQTYALVTDITATHRAGYVGLDNRKAGRTAAWAISRLTRQPGKVGLLGGDHRFLCQELSEISFRSYLREHAPHFQVLDTRLTHEDAGQARQVTEALLADHPDLAALYVNSGGIEGVIEAVRASGRQAEIIVIGHELMESTRSGLVDGVLDLVISLPREATARALVALMVRAPLPMAPEGSPAASVMLPFDLVTAENI
jgi:LacI family transcriptional regulator